MDRRTETRFLTPATPGPGLTPAFLSRRIWEIRGPQRLQQSRLPRHSGQPLPHPFSADPAHPGAQEGGGGPHSPQVAVCSQEPPAGRPGAHARPEERQVQNRLHGKPEAPARRRQGKGVCEARLAGVRPGRPDRAWRGWAGSGGECTPGAEVTAW